ncbi:2-oxoisovalerate dehydrogenase E1 subunit beta [soil metagenome]
MMELTFLIEDAAEGGFTAKALGESIFTQAESLAELKKMVKEAVLCHFEESNMPRIVRLHYVKDEILPIAS